MIYYVSTIGSDSNNGSINSPFLTITYAISQSADGDTINIANGTYTYGTSSANNVLNISKKLTIIGRENSNEGNRPLINISTAAQNTAVNLNNSDITLKGLEFVHNPASTGSNDTCINIAPGGTSVSPDSGVMINENINIIDCKIHFTKFGVASKAKYFSVKNCELVSKAITSARSIAIFSQNGTVDILNNIFNASVFNTGIELLHNNFATNDGYQNKRNGIVNFIGNQTNITIARRAIFFESGTDTGLSGDSYTFNVSNNTIYSTSDSLMLLQPSNSNFLNFIGLITLNNNTFYNNSSLSRNGLVRISALSPIAIQAPNNTPKFSIYSNTIGNSILNPSTNPYNVNDQNVLILTNFTNSDGLYTGGLTRSVIDSILNIIPPIIAPGSPNITGITPGNGTLSVAFTPPTDNGGSSITNYQYSLNGGSFVSGGVSSPLVISNLINGTAYTVIIRAVNTVGPGTNSTGSSGTPIQLPNAPTITGITPGNGTLSVSFTLTTNGGDLPITNYQYSLNGGQFFSAGTFSSPFLISNLTNGTAYTVIIRAVNSNGAGTNSTGLSATPMTTPGAPTMTGITPGNGTLSVAFTPPADNGGSPITNYQYSLNGGSFVSGGTSSSPLLISNLINGTAYTVIIRAVNSVGTGTNSTGLSATPVSTPGAPTITGITPGDGTLSVAFTPPTNNGGSPITNYQYSLNGGSFVSGGTSSPLVISNITNGTSYSVIVRAVNSVGPGTNSTGSSGIPITTPGAPTLTGLTPGNGSLSVAFTPPTDNGGSPITNYQYSLNGGSFVSGGTSSPFLISNLTNGTLYTVIIRALNSVGAGTNSTGSSATPVQVPNAPTITGITPGNGTLTVVFTPPTDNGGSPITNYQYSLNGGSFVSVGSISIPFIISNLINGTNYSVSIRAVNSIGTGLASNVLSSTPITIPDAPVITGITPGNGTLSVAFTIPTNNGGSAITSYQYKINKNMWSNAQSGSPILISELTNGELYAVQIRAINIAGNGRASNVVSSTPITTPNAPIIESIDPGDQQLSINFVGPLFNGGSTITNYQYSLNNGSFVSAGTSTPILIQNLTNKTEYICYFKSN
jgi:hypothetical protein